MSKAAELAALIGSQSALSNKNMVSNGAMLINQRGNVTAASGTALTYGGPDRWRIYKQDSTAVLDISQSTDVPSGQGFKYSYKVDVTTADSSADANDRCDVIFRWEGQDLQHLKKGTSEAVATTVQFWVKSSKTGTHICEMFDNDNSRQISKTYTVNTADTWEHKTVTFEGDTTGAYAADNGNSMQISWWLLSGSNTAGGTLSTTWTSNTQANRAVGQVNVLDSTSNEWYITGVQLEVGEQATPFEHRSFQDEFMRCQRYYQEIHGGSWEPSSSSVVETSFTRLPMRAAATGSVSAAIDIEDPNVTTYTQSSGAIAVGNATARAEKIGLSNFSGLGTSKSFFIKTTGGHIQLDAEL